MKSGLKGTWNPTPRTTSNSNNLYRDEKRTESSFALGLDVHGFVVTTSTAMKSGLKAIAGQC